jgi:ubiquinone/menaquinone biosynthesis C-methylase UbiE
MIQVGRAGSNKQVMWVRGNGFQLPFGQVFDFVYSFRFLRHFHREDRGAYMPRLNECCDPEVIF